MKLKTLIQAGCSFLAFIFVFLPWYNLSFDSYAVGGGDAFSEAAVGTFALIISLVATVWFVLEALISLKVVKLKLPFKEYKNIIDTCLGGLMILMGILAIVHCQVSTSILNSPIKKWTPGIGTILYIIAGAILCTLPWVKLEQVVGEVPKKATKSAEKKEDKKETKKEGKKDEK